LELVSLYLLLPLAVFLMLGVPIAFSLALSCILFLQFSGTRIPSLVIVTEMHSALDSPGMLALPMFVIAGELLNRCNLTDRLIRVALALVGWIRGGLAHASVVGSMFFAGISGSAIADAASIGPIMIPSMIKEGYPRPFSGAIVAAASVIGPIIPPSIPLVIIGGQLQISIGGLFAAGLVPGVLVGLALMLAAYVMCRIGGFGQVRPFPGFANIALLTLVAAPVLVIPLLILGGILLGIFAPTEAGAFTALYTVVIGAVFYRTLNLAKFRDALVSTARITATCLVIVAAAVAYGRILTFHQFPHELLKLILALSENKTLILLLIIGLFIFVGLFMDALANMIILGPLLYPICVTGLGMHPIQFGIFLMVGLLIGLLTPPVGLSLFVVAPIARVSLEHLSLAVLPFLAAVTAVLFLIAFVPEVTLFVPRLGGLVK
jgi:tripartite ATP-independent transporter DctM subunit